MFRAVWPNDDPDDETFLSFRASLAIIPKSVKRRFGYGVRSEDEQMEDESERDRLDAYTHWEA